jgi:uncharacterized alpha-E superfamily protein
MNDLLLQTDPGPGALTGRRVTRGVVPLLSRVAENIYWLARYIERAENTARLVKVNTFLLLDLPRRIAPGWGPLLAITGAEEAFFRRYREAGERQVTKFLIAGTDNPGAILPSLQAARENCRTIRDSVPREGWEQINGLFLYARDQLAAGLSRRGRDAYLNRIILGSQTIAGLLAGTMNHDAGYQFLRIGRNSERADMTTRIIDVRSASLLPELADVQEQFNTVQWMSVLKSLTAYQMYRRTMQARVGRDAVLRFLLQRPEFPRSVAHCLGEVERGVQWLGGDRATLAALAGLRDTLRQARPDTLDPRGLHGFLDGIQLALIRIQDALAGAYFLPPPDAAGSAAAAV